MSAAESEAPKRVQLTVRLPRDLHAVLKAHCASQGVSVNKYLTKVLMETLPDSISITITREK